MIGTETSRVVGVSAKGPARDTLGGRAEELATKVADVIAKRANEADLLITGEALSEFAARHSNLISVRGRLEVKVVDQKTSRIIAIHRQTSIGVDLSEQIAGKAALQEAAALSAVKLLPEFAGKANKRRQK